MSACPHGISARWACQQCSAIDDAPAQLREKVEMLGAALQVINEHVQTQRELNKALADLSKNTNLRLDAALKRIEKLERDMADVLVHPRSGQR